MVARLSGRASDAGEVLDAAVDRYVEFFFLAGLLIYYREIPELMILTMAALLGSFMVSYSSAKAEALQVAAPRGNMRRPERAFYLTLGAVLSPISIPWFEQNNLLPIHVGYPMVGAIAIVALFSNVSAGERLWAIAKAIREKEATLKSENTEKQNRK
jgi:phosphatidylglycerophosphate synthase